MAERYSKLDRVIKDYTNEMLLEVLEQTITVDSLRFHMRIEATKEQLDISNKIKKEILKRMNFNLGAGVNESQIVSE